MKRDKKYPAAIFMLGLCCFIASACQSPSVNDQKLDSLNEDSVSTIEDHPKGQEVQVLTLEDLTSYFPEKIAGLTRVAVHVRQKDKTATAVYGDHQYSISITDDSFNQWSAIRTFNKEYKTIDSKSANKTRIATVLDGYRTLTSIEDENVSITFIFKMRYLIVVTGYQQQTPFRVWQFLELNTFNKLPE